MIRRPPRSTQSRSSAASDVYKRQVENVVLMEFASVADKEVEVAIVVVVHPVASDGGPVSYTHLRAHETVLDLVCRLLLEKKKQHHTTNKF